MQILDISGPDGNAAYIINLTKKWAKDLDKDADAIVAEMKSGDYEKVLTIFEREFGTVCKIIGRN